MNKLLPLSMAMVAYTMLSLGFVLQKKGISWMGWKGEKNKTFFKNLSLWIAGFVIMNIYGIPSAIALKTLPPHMVSSFAGWGMVMLVFFSFWILKEKLYPMDYVYSSLIVAGIILLGVFEKPAQPGVAVDTFDTRALIVFCSFPLFAFLLGLPKGISTKIKVLCFASVSGMTAGLMVVSLRLLVLQMGYDISGYLNSPYLYLYAGAALLSLISLQLALKNGQMIAVGPLQYGATIVYPLLASIMIFKQPVQLMQFLAVAMIVYAVIFLLKKH